MTAITITMASGPHGERLRVTTAKDHGLNVGDFVTINGKNERICNVDGKSFDVQIPSRGRLIYESMWAWIKRVIGGRK